LRRSISLDHASENFVDPSTLDHPGSDEISAIPSDYESCSTRFAKRNAPSTGKFRRPLKLR
jgi:hypothetical protein